MDEDPQPERSSSSNDEIHSLLVSSPIEVLATITSHLKARGLCRLWFCGNTFLNERLGARGGVTHFALDQDSLSPQKWPSLIAHLPHITRLSIDNNGDPDFTESIPTPLELPPQLRALELAFTGCAQHFCGGLAHSPARFQTLESLKLISSSSKIKIKEIEPLRALPSLSGLTLAFISYNGALSDFLFPGLVKVHLYLEHVDTINFKLPSSLQHFQMRTGSHFTIDGNADFPAGLQSVHIVSRKFRASTKFFASLPRNLKHLTIPTEESLESVLKAVPPFLLTLDLLNFQEQITLEHLKLFPRTITQSNLLMDLLPAINLENADFLPPQLLALKRVPNNLPVLEKLPPGLTSLVCDRFTQDPISNHARRIALPQNLTEVTSLAPELLEFCTLPESLVDLQIATGAFNAQHARGLPRGLKSLIFSSPLLDCVSLLPSRLTTLHVHSDTVAWTLSTADAMLLPRTLTVLTLGEILVESAETLSHLPDGLQDLALYLPTLENDCLGSLSRTRLKTLTLTVDRDHPGLGDAILTNMPRTLTILRYNVLTPGCKDIAVDSFKLLPRGLYQLSIPDSPQIRSLTEKPTFWPPELAYLCCVTPFCGPFQPFLTMIHN